MAVVTYFLWFVLYSVVGWIYESTLCSITGRRLTNRGFLNGPYCPIYGSGALLVIVLFEHISNPLQLFLCSAVVCTVLEYLTSYVMEKLFHARWWDYSKRAFNVNGRVCLLGMVVFGLLSVVIVMYVHPLVQRLTDLISMPARCVAAALLGAGMLADCWATLHAMADFRKKLEEAEQLLAKSREAAKEKLLENEAVAMLREHHRELARRISGQQKRLLLAFPQLRLHRHDELFVNVREAFCELRKKGKRQNERK